MNIPIFGRFLSFFNVVTQNQTTDDLEVNGTPIVISTTNGVTQNPSTGDLEVGGEPIIITDMVDTWADLQAIPKIAGNDGIAILCKEVGVGAGSVWIYLHATTTWYPENGQAVVGRFVNVAKVGADTVKEIFAQVYFPSSAGVCCFGQGDVVKFLESYDKTGTAGGFSKGWQVGSTGLVGSDVDLDFGSSASTSHDIGGLTAFRRDSDTSIKKLYSTGSNTFVGLATSGKVATATVPSINSNGLYLSSVFNLADAADSVVYEYGEMILVAGV